MVRPGGAVFGMSSPVPLLQLTRDMQLELTLALLPAGSLVGAGGVTAYNAYHSNDWGVVKTLQWWIEKGNVDAARANNPEFARLEDMVQPP